jgi:hypothetical protein
LESERGIDHSPRLARERQMVDPDALVGRGH